MSEISTYMIIKGSLALFLIFGGMYALKKGFELYITGVGLSSDSLSLSSENKIGKINISLKRTGTVVMLTSIIWAGLGYLSLPKSIHHSENISKNGSHVIDNSSNIPYIIRKEIENN